MKRAIPHLLLGLGVLVLWAGCADREKEAALKAEEEAKARRSEAREKVVSVFRRMKSSVEVGMNISGYNQLLLETKPAIDEYLSILPVDDFATYTKSSMEIYIDAASFWRACLSKRVQYGVAYYFSKADQASWAKYELPWMDGEYAGTHFVQYFWIRAETEAQKATIVAAYLNSVVDSPIEK